MGRSLQTERLSRALKGEQINQIRIGNALDYECAYQLPTATKSQRRDLKFPVLIAENDGVCIRWGFAQCAQIGCADESVPVPLALGVDDGNIAAGLEAQHPVTERDQRLWALLRFAVSTGSVRPFAELAKTLNSQIDYN